MKNLELYITSLLDGVADNYEVHNENGVYVITIVVDMSYREDLMDFLPLIRDMGRSAIRRRLETFLPNNLYHITAKVIEPNVQQTEKSNIILPISCTQTNQGR